MIEGLEVVRNPRARRLKLTLDRVSGRARLVLPARAALNPALAWAGAQADWLAEQRARLPQRQPFAIGLVLTIDDRPVTIVRGEGARRTLDFDGAALSVAGPLETLPRRVEAWLKRRALDLLAEGESLVAAEGGALVGTVRVASPSDLTRGTLLPWFDDFLAAHPGVQLALSVWGLVGWRRAKERE